MADIPPPPIEHRSLENHYTKYISHIEECTYTKCRHTEIPRSDIPPPPIKHRSLENHYTE